MNGQVFPSETDHPNTISNRFTNMCNEGSRVVEQQRKYVFLSSQNAALIQYKINPKSSFIVHVKHIRNPDRKYRYTTVIRDVLVSHRKTN